MLAWAFILAWPVAMVSGITVAAMARGSGLRLASALVATVAGIGVGIGVEKLLYLNRHIDLCVDDIAAYYRTYNRFDPWCEVMPGVR